MDGNYGAVWYGGLRISIHGRVLASAAASEASPRRAPAGGIGISDNTYGSAGDTSPKLPTYCPNGQHVPLWITAYGLLDHSTLAGMTSFNTRAPFTRTTALRQKLSDHELQSSRFRRIYQGVYISADVRVTTKVRAQAAMLVAPDGSYISHHTAARLWGGWAPKSSVTHISSPGDLARTQRRGLAAHRADPNASVVTRYGLPIAAPTRVFLDLASAGLSLVDLVAAGDALVKAKCVTPQELLDAAGSWPGKYCRRARRAAGFVRVGVDSVMETRLRMLMVLARLPEPQVNKILRFDDGTWERRIDIYYLAILLAIEYEGRQHAESVEQWNKDIRRRTRLEAMGWRFILVTAEGIYDHPEETLNDIKNALRDRGVRTTARRPPVEWYREFVGEPIAR